MAVNAALARVYGSEIDAVWLAPIGTPAPTDVNSALDAAFQEVGWLDSDTGITESILGKQTELRGHQGNGIVRVITSESGKQYKFVALEDKPLTRTLFDKVTASGTTASGARSETVSPVQPVAKMLMVVDMYDQGDTTVKERIIATVNIVPDGDRKYVATEIGSARGFIATVLGSYTKLSTNTGAKTGWTVTVTGTPTGGTFSLVVNGYATPAIAYNAANTAVQSAINGLSGVTGVTATVTGSGPYSVTFSAAAFLSATSALTGGSSPSVTVA